MDKQTLESIAEMICGEPGPVYRKGWELTEFFKRVGFSNLQHDGTTRKWWTLSTLETLTDNNLKAVILRLADPKEYRGDKKVVDSAIQQLNMILSIEGFEIVLEGIKPRLIQKDAKLYDSSDDELIPIDPPDFSKLSLEPGLGNILEERWNEAQKCMNSEAYLAGTIIMGSMLEGILLSVINKNPSIANRAKCSPKDKVGVVKVFGDWNLSEMINVAHEVGWLGLDVKKYSHVLREFRNLIHPYQQWITDTRPDDDTCKMNWLVVQAAVNDLSKKLI
jgi:hypothetical protein